MDFLQKLDKPFGLFLVLLSPLPTIEIGKLADVSIYIWPFPIDQLS